jgi:hypothetical protein
LALRKEIEAAPLPLPLIRQLGALLNQGFGLIGRNDRGLATTLPRPSASIAEISRFKNDWHPH